MYILDAGNNRVQRYTAGASSGTTIISASFSNPRGIAFDPYGNIAIADYSYARVVKASIYCGKLIVGTF